jgi:hypothetical protein
MFVRMISIARTMPYPQRLLKMGWLGAYVVETSTTVAPTWTIKCD